MDASACRCHRCLITRYGLDGLAVLGHVNAIAHSGENARTYRPVAPMNSDIEQATLLGPRMVAVERRYQAGISGLMLMFRYFEHRHHPPRRP